MTHSGSACAYVNWAITPSAKGPTAAQRDVGPLDEATEVDERLPFLTVNLIHLEREVASHVFISYARTNQPYAQDLAKFLKDHGIPVWYDYQLEAGEIFWKTIKTTSTTVSRCSSW